ncbi:MAG: hypothetical protein RR588_02005 [Solibacillus sp.]
MKDIIQTKLAKLHNISEGTMREIIGIALEFNPGFVYYFGRNVLLPESSENAVVKIIEIKETSGLSYVNATKFYFTEYKTDTQCKTCGQREKEIERLSRLLRLSYKTI